MKVISLNVNGLRSAQKKGFFDWMLAEDADVVCLQEIRIQEEQLSVLMKAPQGYSGYFHFAEKKGYSGVAIYVKEQPDQVRKKMDWELWDAEGRFIQVDYGKLSIVSLYLPSGSSKESRQSFKMQTLAYWMNWIEEQVTNGRELLICGDFNLAHQEIDLKNWKGNQKNPGFLPEERAWLTQLLTEKKMVDVFRRLNPNPDQYTWWSNRGQAWAKNVGWRIDYQLATPTLAQSAVDQAIYKDSRFSDHAPLIIEYQQPLS